MAQLYSELSGVGDDLLVLLHGLGATGDIWSPLIAAAPAKWPGRILLVDLPGHGASPGLDSYDMATVTAAVGAVIDEARSGSGRWYLLGHSYGGVVALELANASAADAQRPIPDRVYGLGIKTVWTTEEVEGVHWLSQKPPKLFADRQAAQDWYLKVAGLAAFGELAQDCCARGVMARSDGQWCLAQDPLVNAITPPDMSALTGDLQGRFRLAYGAEDALVDADDLANIDPGARRIDGGGHNLMVNNPEAVLAWLDL